MSVAPSHDHRPRLPRARYWPAIGAGLAGLVFVPAWSQAAVQVAHGAAQVHIAQPLAMSFNASSLYPALVLGLLACAAFGALAGGALAAMATLPAHRR